MSKCAVCDEPVDSYSLDVTVDVPYVWHTYHKIGISQEAK